MICFINDYFVPGTEEMKISLFYLQSSPSYHLEWQTTTRTLDQVNHKHNISTHHLSFD